MGHKNVSQLEIWVKLKNNVSQLKKVTLKKSITVGNMHGSHLKYYVTVGKGVTLQTMSHLRKKWATFGKIFHTRKNVSHLKEWVTFKK